MIFVIGILLAGAFVLSQGQMGYPGWKADSLNKEVFLDAWKADIDLLRKSNKLPSAFEHLSQIELQTVSETLKPWVKDHDLGFPLVSGGQFKLQVFLDDFSDDHHKGVMIQYYLVELSTLDTVWELGRTLTF